VGFEQPQHAALAQAIGAHELRRRHAGPVVGEELRHALGAESIFRSLRWPTVMRPWRFIGRQ
jgi:hypothetical protein